LKETREKERQRELAAALREAEAAQAALEDVDRRLLERRRRARRGVEGPVGPWRLLLASEDLARLREQRLVAEERLSESRRQVEERRQELLEAAKERKILEALRERDYEVFRSEEARREQRHMDELAQQTGERRRAGDVRTPATPGKKERVNVGKWAWIILILIAALVASVAMLDAMGVIDFGGWVMALLERHPAIEAHAAIYRMGLDVDRALEEGYQQLAQREAELEAERALLEEEKRAL